MTFEALTAVILFCNSYSGLAYKKDRDHQAMCMTYMTVCVRNKEIDLGNDKKSASALDVANCAINEGIGGPIKFDKSVK